MKIRALLGAGLIATIGAGLVAPSANAAIGTDSTAVTVSLSGGAFTLDAPTSASGTGDVTPLSTVTVSLNDTTVTDNRGTLLGWTVTATSSGLTGSGSAAGVSISPATMTWATGTIASPSGALGLLGNPANINVSVPGTGALTGAVAAVAGVGVGGGVYTYPATVTVVVPLDAKAGSYAGTIVQTAV
jgi:hypothetical protein